MTRQSAIKFTVLVALGGEKHLDRFLITHKTWALKKEISSAPLTILHNSIDTSKLAHIDATLIPWRLEGASSMREQMLSAFVFGARAITTEYYLKIDADCYFSDDQPIITKDIYKYDIAAHKWGYTKPGNWLRDLDKWATQAEVPGNNLNALVVHETYSHKRIISWLCMHKTSFVLECLGYVTDKLPVPSHDTFLWYMANRLKKKCGRMNFKKYGAHHSKHLPSFLTSSLTSPEQPYHIDQQSAQSQSHEE